MPSRFLERALAAHPNGSSATLEAAQVPMAFTQVKHRMAIAAYDESCSRIILEDVFVGEGETLDVAQRIISSIRPSFLLLPSAAIRDSELLDVLTTSLRGNDEEETDENQANENIYTHPEQTIPYRLMKSSNFEIRSCKRRIMKLRVESLKRQPRHDGSRYDGTERQFPLQESEDRVYNASYFHALSSVIDFDSNAQVQALGALLAFLHENNADLETGIMTVNQVVKANSSMYVSLSAEAISALQIFSTEHHPLVATKQDGNSKAKEGHSLFSLLDRTRSHAGRELLKDWMLKPLRDVGEITARQDGVELFMLPDLQNSVGTIYRLMDRIGTVQKIVARVQKCTSKPNDYLVLLRSLSAAVTIVDTLHDEILWKVRVRAGPKLDDAEIDERNPQALAYLDFMDTLLDQCEPDRLYSLFEMMVRIVDEEAMEDSKRQLVIREGYSERLDSQKQSYSQLRETLVSCTAAIEATYPHFAGLINLVFFPQVSVVLCHLDPSNLSRRLGFSLALATNLTGDLEV